MVSTHEVVYFFSVHVKVDEKVTLVGGRDGGLQNMEIRGLVLLRISDSQFGKICLKVENDDKKGFQMQVVKEVIFLNMAESEERLNSSSLLFIINSETVCSIANFLLSSVTTPWLYIRAGSQRSLPASLPNFACYLHCFTSQDMSKRWNHNRLLFTKLRLLKNLKKRL